MRAPFCLLLLTGMCWASPASATDPALADGPADQMAVPKTPELQAEQPDRLPFLLIDARIGGLFPSVFNKLETTFTVHAGVSWQFAFDRALGIFFDAAYSEPTSSGTRTDPRLTTNGGVERWRLAVRELGLALGPRLGFHVGQRFDGYVGAGGVLSLTRSVSTATAGEADLGTNTEYSTRLGILVRGGIGFKLGPGAIVAELAIAHLPVDHVITGVANTSSLSLQIGYAFYLR